MISAGSDLICTTRKEIGWNPPPLLLFSLMYGTRCRGNFFIFIILRIVNRHNIQMGQEIINCFQLSDYFNLGNGRVPSTPSIVVNFVCGYLSFTFVRLSPRHFLLLFVSHRFRSPRNVFKASKTNDYFPEK